MRALGRRFSRVMKAGVVHQLAISLDALVVDLDATNRSPVAMALIRSDRLHVVVARGGKQFLSVHAGHIQPGCRPVYVRQLRRRHVSR